MTLDTSLTGDINSNLAGGWDFNGFDVFLNWETAMSSLALPADLPDSGRFLASTVHLPGGASGSIQGILTSVHAVPEPSTLVLTSLAALGLAAR